MSFAVNLCRAGEDVPFARVVMDTLPRKDERVVYQGHVFVVDMVSHNLDMHAVYVGVYTDESTYEMGKGSFSSAHTGNHEPGPNCTKECR